MIDRLIAARTDDERTLEFLRLFLLVLVLIGFGFYGAEHWVVGHYLESWQSRIPFIVSLVGLPLALWLFFSCRPLARYPFIVWMAVSALTGVVGAVLHLVWNAADAEVTLWSIGGFLEALRGERPVLAALAHTHIGAIGLLVGATIREPKKG
jgi:FtsH-binding integral membrane protein